MRRKGRIVSWNEARGFGFVSPADGGSDVFVHARAFQNRSRQPQLHDVISFSMQSDDRGRPCAAEVRYAGEKAVRQRAGNRRRTAVAVAVLFPVAVGLAATVGVVDDVVLYAYLGMSLLTIAAYGIDKRSARRGSWRTKESTLLLFGLAGGWPGAILAQEYLRHKSSKASFRSLFWTTVVMNCAALGWLLTDDGKHWLSGLLATMA